MKGEDGLSMSFVDVFSLSFLAVLVLYATSISDQKRSQENFDYEILIVDQSSESIDHLAMISVDVGGKRHIWYANDRLSQNEYSSLPRKRVVYQKYKNKEFKDFAFLLQEKFDATLSVSTEKPRRVAVNTTQLSHDFILYVGFDPCTSNDLHTIECEIMRSEEDGIVDAGDSYFREEDFSTWKDNESVWYVTGSRDSSKAINNVIVSCKKGNSSITVL